MYFDNSNKLSGAQEKALIETLAALLDGYEKELALWVVAWGRDTYRRSIEELVAQVDSRCFEYHRLNQRFVRSRFSGDTITANALRAQMDADAKKWLCVD
jgi:hypothetical protein